MNCPSCNTELQPGQRVCQKCGAVVTSEVAVTPPPPPPLPPSPPPARAGAFAPPSFDPPTVADVGAPTSASAASFNIVEQTVPVNGQQGWTGGGWPAEHQAGDAPTTQFPQPQPAPTGPAWDIPEAHPAPTAAYPVVDGQPGYVIAPAYVPAVPAVGRGSAVLAAVAVLAGVAAIVASFLPMLTIKSDAPIDALGDYKLNDLAGTNLQVAIIVAGACILIGGVLAKLGQRFGAGLAGGAALGLAAFIAAIWAVTDAISKGAEAVARVSASSGAGGTFYEGKPGIGFWVLVGAAGLGVIGLLIALAQSGNDGRARLNIGICAAGALAAIAAAAGPLVPENNASFTDNMSRDGGSTALLYARLGIMGLVALVGVIGFIRRNRWGIGLAIGGASLYIWQWISSLAKLGDHPAPPAFFNPGAAEPKPHIVTTIGIIAMLGLAVLAILVGLRKKEPVT